MINLPLLDELRVIRRRLSEEMGNDVERYAAMLQAGAEDPAAEYISEPVLPTPRSLESTATGKASPISSAPDGKPSSSSLPA
jgi:hypothetical protein